METRAFHCPNCSAPVAVAVGDVEATCGYRSSLLRFVPDQDEMEIVRTRGD